MKRTIKNKKVIKAITIGLAAMITATSSPIEVLAEEENQNVENQETNNENETQKETSVSEVASECAEIISEENNQIIEATEEISDASNAVGEIITSATEQEITIPAETLENIQTELQQSANEFTQAGSDLKIAVQSFNETLVSDLNTEKIITNTESDLINAQNTVSDFNNENKETTNDANKVITQANIANTSDSKDEAYTAKDNAIKGLAETEKKLAIAEDAYKVAKDATDAADQKYQDALKEQQKTKEKLADAKDKLKDANENATAANERLKAIQSQMDQIDKEVITLAQSKDDLKALEEQYHKLLVHYYRDPAINSAVYDENGKLLPKDSANKAVTDGKVDNHPSLNENTLKIGRELMKDLVMYKLKANGAEDIQFAVQEKGLTKKQSADGELTTDNKGNEKVNIGETQDQYWTYPSGDDGRHHRVKVTYTITTEEGKKEVTEYYNYIIKAGKYNDNTDMTNGPIYLAQINNETGEVIRDTDKNNMDDYIKLGEELNKAIDAVKLLDEYDNAKKAVDDAQSLVDKINKTIDKLSKEDIKINESRIKDLEKQLKDAKEILKLASEDKAKLEDKVEEARKAVAAIDLSRFDITTGDEDITIDTETSVSMPVTYTIPSTAGLVPSESVVTTTSTTGATIETNEVNNEGAPVEETPDAGVAGVKIDPEKSENPELVKLEDEEIPLAEIPEILNKEHSLIWWVLFGWLLLLLLLIYIIYKMIKKYKEKKEEAKKEKEKQ